MSQAGQPGRQGSGVIGRRVASPAAIERPGDYCGPVRGYTDDVEACFFLKPNARDEGVPPHSRSVQHVCFPPHAYRECPDGSLPGVELVVVDGVSHMAVYRA